MGRTMSEMGELRHRVAELEWALADLVTASEPIDPFNGWEVAERFHMSRCRALQALGKDDGAEALTASAPSVTVPFAETSPWRKCTRSATVQSRRPAPKPGSPVERSPSAHQRGQSSACRTCHGCKMLATYSPALGHHSLPCPACEGGLGGAASPDQGANRTQRSLGGVD